MPAKIDPIVAMAIPTWGKVSVNWARAFRHLGGPLGTNMVELAPIVGQPIAEARNELMQAAIANNADFIFFLGDDVLPQPDAIIKLLHRMWENPDMDVLTGMYWTKQWPTAPYIWRGLQRGPYLDWKHGELIELDFAGCDCLMVRLTPAIKALGPEWFSTTWTWNENEDAPPLLATEDFYFYTKLRKAGIRLWCDTGIQCIHEDRNSGMQFGLTEDMPQYSNKKKDLPEAHTDDAPLVRIADIGSGYDTPFFGQADACKVYRFDGDEKSQPDYRCDLRHLPVLDQTFDLVHSRHVLEHFGRAEAPKVLTEWARILRVGGEFRLSVPNILHAMRQILLMEEEILPPDRYPFWQLYGEQKDHYDFHQNGWTPRRIKLLFESMGFFEDVDVQTGVTGPGEDEDVNIFVTARKSSHPSLHALIPDWQEIEAREGITVAGLNDGNRSEPQLPVEKAVRVGRGVRKTAQPVGAGAASNNGASAGDTEGGES